MHVRSVSHITDMISAFRSGLLSLVSFWLLQASMEVNYPMKYPPSVLQPGSQVWRTQPRSLPGSPPSSPPEPHTPPAMAVQAQWGKKPRRKGRSMKPSRPPRGRKQARRPGRHGPLRACKAEPPLKGPAAHSLAWLTQRRFQPALHPAARLVLRKPQRPEKQE